MRQRYIIRLLLLLVAAIVWPAPAEANRVDRLVRILKTAKSYKVRLQVVITLGKLKDSRALPALIGALRDSNHTVRGVAATALGQIGDTRAKPHLKRMARSDSNSFARGQAKKALRALQGGGGPPPGARFYVTVGKVTNKTGKGGSGLAEAFRKALIKEFSGVRGVAVPWSSRDPSARTLRKLRLKGFVLDGSILKAGKKRSGGGFEISCSIRVSLSTFPGNSMKAFYSGGAGMQVDSVRPEYEASLYKEIVEGAAQGARQHIVRSYLSTQ